MEIIIFLIGLLVMVVIPTIIGRFFPITRIWIIDGWLWIFLSASVILGVLVIIFGIYLVGKEIHNLFI